MISFSKGLKIGSVIFVMLGFVLNLVIATPVWSDNAIPSGSPEIVTINMFGSPQNNEIIIIGMMGVFLIMVLIWLVQVKMVKDKLRLKQEQAHKVKQKYRLIVEHSDEAILIAQNLEFKYANRQVYDIMGLPDDQTISRNLVDYIYPEDLNIVLESYEKTMLNKSSETSFKVRLIKEDKSCLWVHVRLVPVLWEDEPANLAFMRDITREKMMEQDLHQAQRMEALGALSGGIAHDFNNILTTIIGNAEVALMECSGDDPGTKEFNQIRESGYRARDLVRQILSISREHTDTIEPLYLSPIIKEAIKLLRSTLPKHFNITENIDKQLKLVNADSVQVYQIFMNLCTNAKQAMENIDIPSLEIELTNKRVQPTDSGVTQEVKPGKYVKLGVKDNGPGIDKKIHSKIFDPY